MLFGQNIDINYKLLPFCPLSELVNFFLIKKNYETNKVFTQMECIDTALPYDIISNDALHCAHHLKTSVVNSHFAQ